MRIYSDRKYCPFPPWEATFAGRRGWKKKLFATTVGAIAHFFNDMLMAMLGQIALLQLNGCQGEAAQRAMRESERAIQEGALVISRMLGLAGEGIFRSGCKRSSRLLSMAAMMFSAPASICRLADWQNAAIKDKATTAAALSVILKFALNGILRDIQNTVEELWPVAALTPDGLKRMNALAKLMARCGAFTADLTACLNTWPSCASQPAPDKSPAGARKSSLAKARPKDSLKIWGKEILYCIQQPVFHNAEAGRPACP